MLLSLFVGIMVTMVKRRLSVAVNPLSGHESLVLIDKNYLTNTVEQLVLGVMLMLITATYTDSPQVLRLLPIYSVLFVIGRVLFPHRLQKDQSLCLSGDWYEYES